MSHWGQKNVLKYFVKNRSRAQDLFKSEKIHLNKVKKKYIQSVLDYGCAAGNFYNIFKSLFKNKISYVGIDSETQFINIAKKIYKKNKNTNFLVQKGSSIKIRSKSVNLVFCTSVLHHTANYKKIILELIRISSRYIFIDSPRVHFESNQTGKMNLSVRHPDAKSKKLLKENIVGYHVINLKDYFLFLKKNFVKNKIFKADFFCSELPYSKKYLSFNKKIFFLTILMEKNFGINNGVSYNLNTKNKKIKLIFHEVF